MKYKKDMFKLVKIPMFLVVFYLVTRFIMSTPYYMIMVIYFSSPDSRILNCPCKDFNILSSVVQKNNNGYTVNYIEDGTVKAFSLGYYDSKYNEKMLKIPIDQTSFLILSESEYNINNLIVLVSEKYRISIGVSGQQIKDHFFQEFIHKYDQCMKEGFDDFPVLIHPEVQNTSD